MQPATYAEFITAPAWLRFSPNWYSELMYAQVKWLEWEFPKVSNVPPLACPLAYPFELQILPVGALQKFHWSHTGALLLFADEDTMQHGCLHFEDLKGIVASAPKAHADGFTSLVMEFVGHNNAVQLYHCHPSLVGLSNFGG